MRFPVFPAGLALAASLATTPRAPDLHALYAEHRWPELRQALAAGDGPALYRGAVAAVFHQDAEAENLLRAVIGEAPRSDDAYEAHRTLARMHLRNGQYRRLWSDLDERGVTFPGRGELETERSELAGFRGLPDQRLRRSRSLTVPELKFEIGGATTVLRPARVVLRDIGAAGCVGNLGLDLLTQTGAFSVDFSSMRLELTPEAGAR